MNTTIDLGTAQIRFYTKGDLQLAELSTLPGLAFVALPAEGIGPIFGKVGCHLTERESTALVHVLEGMR